MAFDLLQLSMAADDYGWFFFMLTTVPVIAASALRIVMDYVRAGGDTRQQLKWLAWVLAIGGSVFLVSMIPLPVIDDAHDFAGLILFIGSPVAVGLAVTKYRLYEIDRIISRTVTYALVVGLLAAVFFGMVTLLAGLPSPDQPPVVAASTLAVFVLFNPLRKRVQVWVDKRFNRSRYDAERIVERFTGTLRDRVDPDCVVEGWVGVVEETMQPSRVGAWVRE